LYRENRQKGGFLLHYTIMEKSKQAVFQISLKVLLHNGDKVLLTRAQEGDIDLPGGRIDAGEENMSFGDVILREVREELGESVKFRLGPVLFVHHIGYTKEDGWVLNIVFDAEYISGDIKLSEEHMSYEWVDRKSYKVLREDFPQKDQEKYETFKKYFDSTKGL